MNQLLVIQLMMTYSSCKISGGNDFTLLTILPSTPISRRYSETETSTAFAFSDITFRSARVHLMVSTWSFFKSFFGRPLFLLLYSVLFSTALSSPNLINTNVKQTCRIPPVRDEKTGFRFNRNIAGYLKLKSASLPHELPYVWVFLFSSATHSDPYNFGIYVFCP